MTGTWGTDWATNDVVTAAEFRKSMGCVFDSTLGGAAATIDITGIPTTYAHLMVMGYLRGDNASTAIAVTLRLNNDSGANYDVQGVRADGTTVVGDETVGATSIGVGDMCANAAVANDFTAFQIEIPNYGGATNHKAVLCRFASRFAAAATNRRMTVRGGQWFAAAAAVNRLTFGTGGGNFVAGSRVSVYVMGS